MNETHPAVVVTVWLAVAAWGLVTGAGLARHGLPCARWIWLAGWAAYVAHVVAAFATEHGWSHRIALEETARQTREATGFDSGAGLWLNYLFGVLWGWDAVVRFVGGGARAGGPGTGGRRWLLDGFLGFMVFNGTVVFGSGPVRWFGLGVFLFLAVAYLLGRVRPGRAAVGLGMLLVAVLVAGRVSAAPEMLSVAPDVAVLDDPGVPSLDEAVREALAGDGLALEPSDDPHGWWRGADDARPFRLSLSVGSEGFDGGVLTVWNWHNAAVAQRQFDAGEGRSLELAVKGQGAYLLTLDGIRGGRAVRRLVRCLARTGDRRDARADWRNEEFFLGVCAFPGRYHWRAAGKPVLPSGLGEGEARALEAGLLARAGFSVVRPDVSVEMGLAAGDSEGYELDFTRMDDAVEAYVSRGFRLALQIMNAGDWAISADYAGAEGHRQPYPREEAHQRAWTRSIVERYGRHARFVQIHNEPDQPEFWAGTPEEFVRQHRAMLGEIRRVAPVLPVANGGYCFVDEGRSSHYIRELRGLADYQAYHAHGPLSTVKRNFARMRELHEAEGYGEPVYLNTETGFDAWRLDQERRQGQALPQRTLYCWAHRHRGVLLFCGRMTRGPGREGRDLGILDYEFGPRFAYATVGALVGALVGASFDAVLAEEEAGPHLYRFRRDGEWILAGFVFGSEAAELAVGWDGGPVAAIDEMGNEGMAEAEGGVLRLALDGYPRYWVFPGDRAPDLVLAAPGAGASR